MNTLRLFYSEKNLLFLNLLWMLSFPFGAKIASFSIGFLTIYPNFVISLFLFSGIFFTWKSWGNWYKIIFFFLSFWFFFSLLRSTLFTNIDAAAKFDLRSLFMQMIYCGALFTLATSIKRNAFQQSFLTGIKLVLFILIGFGTWEFITANHFFDSKSVFNSTLPPESLLLHAPRFVYENVNDYILVLSFYLMLFFLVKKNSQQDFLLSLLSGIIIYLFSIFASSEFGKIIAYGFLFYSFLKIIEVQKFKEIPKIYYLTILISFIFILTQKIEVNFAISHPKIARLNSISILQKTDSKSLKIESARNVLTKKELREMSNYLDSVEMNRPDRSVSLRKNLIFNGFFLIAKNPILGTGAGGYRRMCERKENPYFIKDHVSPHNFFIEIVSQYGYLGWLYFFFFGIIVFQIIRKFLQLRKKNLVFKILFFTLFPIFWMMPSAYLYLDIHWLTLPFFSVFLVHMNLPVESE